MKRFLCVLIVCLMVAPAAFATDFSDFSIYAELFGAHEVKESEGDVRDDCIRFVQDGCIITFRIQGGEITNAMITGDGDAFLAYSLATLMQFDPDSKNAAENGGQLLLYYLMGKAKNGEHLGQTVSGKFFKVEKTDDGFSLSIVK